MGRRRGQFKFHAFTRMFILRNECLFSGVMGNESERGTNKSREPVLGRFVCSALRFIPPTNPEKVIHSLYLQCFQQRPLSKKSYKFKILAGCSNGPLTSFDTSIIAHVKCRTAGLLFDNGYRVLNC